MDKPKSSNKVFRVLVILFLIILLTTISISLYNKKVENKAINSAISAINSAFNGNANYYKKSNRIIINVYKKNEAELYELTREALPKLSLIGDHDVMDILSVRNYYSESRDDFQYYDIRFKDISKINWNEINDFEDFLFYINVE